MAIWGTLLGASAGFAIGGPLGALLGLAAGGALDMYRSENTVAPGEDATQKLAFTIGVIVLSAKMARADGMVKEVEIAAFREAFHVPPEELRHVSRVFDIARREPSGFEPYARQLARLLRGRRDVLEQLLGGLFHIAQADGCIDETEITFLHAVARLFGFDALEFRRIKATYGVVCGTNRLTGVTPYAVLGVSPSDDDAAIRAAWRRLVRQHHPDHLIGRGMPPEFVELASQQLAAINAAYDRIRAMRGVQALTPSGLPTGG